MSYGKKLNNRIIITSIRIKNFRSIKNALIKVKDMNIFVDLLLTKWMKKKKL